MKTLRNAHSNTFQSLLHNSWHPPFQHVAEICNNWCRHLF